MRPLDAKEIHRVLTEERNLAMTMAVIELFLALIAQYSIGQLAVFLWLLLGIEAGYAWCCHLLLIRFLGRPLGRRFNKEKS